MAAKLAGGGKGGRELRQNADINVTPFVDVMLVLLIIFMVAAPLATTAIRIDLPASSRQGQKHRPTFISIRRGGETFVVGETETQRVADLAGLSPVLAAKLGGAGAATRQTVLIRADRDVRYSEFMAVVNQLQRDGYYKVGLISEELG